MMEPLTIKHPEADQKLNAAIGYAQVWSSALQAAVRDCVTLPAKCRKFDTTVCLTTMRRNLVLLRLTLHAWVSSLYPTETTDILLYQYWVDPRPVLLFYTEITRESFLRRVSLWMRKRGCQVKQSELWAHWQLCLLTNPTGGTL